MTVRFTFPEPLPVPDTMTIHATSAPDWTPDRLTALAETLGVRAEVSDAGLWFVARDERSALEVYQATRSLRFTRFDQDGEPLRPVEVDDSRATETAEEWLRAVGPDDARPGTVAVTDLLVEISESPGSEPRGIVNGRQVNFSYELDGVPLLGPGAKAQVTVDADGEVAGAYSFWRTTSPQRDAQTIGPDETYARFRRSRLFAGLDDGDAVITSVRLGHFAAPPTETQSVLGPAYELRGILRTGDAPQYEFVRYLPAVTPSRSRRVASELRTLLHA